VFYSKIHPEKTNKPKKVLINNSLCSELNIDHKYLESEEGINILSGNTIHKDTDPLAMVYAGHQFGNWVPKLGDGRAHLLGEVIDKKGNKLDVQLKGSGKTPYSRGGDGKAWLGPVIREYLVSEYMHNINISTTRSLSAILTGDNVYREEIYPGAVLCRVAKSHIRVGTFQYFLAKKDIKSLKVLADYFIKRNLPDLEKKDNKYFNFFKIVVDGHISLVTKWMKVGFIHGVMNTDNTSIACETIDYGPCAFMDHYKSDKVFSSIDTMGRYCYKNQPNIMMWNMACFASTLLPLLGDDTKKNTSKLQNEIISIPERYKNKWLEEFSKKIGLNKDFSKNEKLINSFLNILEKESLDYTNSFSSLKSFLEKKYICKNRILQSWVDEWRDRIKKEYNIDEVRLYLESNNPQFIIRNHILESTIKQLLNKNKKGLNNLLKVIRKPFEKLEGLPDFYKEPSVSQEVKKTFCGT